MTKINLVTAKLTCTNCHRTQPVYAFYSRPGAARGYEYRCRDCCAGAARNRRADNPERQRAADHKYRASPQSKRAEFEKKLWQLYGMRVEDYARMFEAQKGRCPGCLELLRLDGNKTTVDHCHATGIVRGLLCRLCNLALGSVHESNATLDRLSQYLDRARRKLGAA